MIQLWIECKHCNTDFEADSRDIHDRNIVDCPKCHTEIELDEHQTQILNLAEVTRKRRIELTDD